jgi:glycogen debranching enzyme
VVAVGGQTALTVLDGIGFAISDRNGDMRGGAHGYVHADRRHLSRFVLTVDGTPLVPVASATPTPFEALVVHRLRDAVGQELPGVIVRRRTLSGGLAERVELWATGARPMSVVLSLSVGTDFAHIFDVKNGGAGPPAAVAPVPDGVDLVASEAGGRTRIRWDRPAESVDDGVVRWHLQAAPRERSSVAVVVEPANDRTVAWIDSPQRGHAIPMRDLTEWRRAGPMVTSTDPRLAVAVDQSFADLLALQLRDAAHPDRVLVAAGAPWFMTLFGRDSLLTAWMTLPFDATLASGVLATLADLQGQHDDPASEEEPGRILHEVRHGGSGPFTERDRYFGSIDSTPLFLMLAEEAWRWGALDEGAVLGLGPAIEAALGWLARRGVPERFLAYRRPTPQGLSNQGWKDSWDGVTFADGNLAEAPISLVEVQGYAYAALVGAAELAAVLGTALDPADLRARAARLRQQFNDRFWLPAGYFALGLDANGRAIDSLTTNPGHALWCGIAEPELADQYLDRLLERDLWSGWGLRTLATSMGAFDPMSYHDGSVWPHDTAICAAGAARYGRWDVVDAIVDGALDAAAHFGGRPPELFAGFARDDVGVPVPYPASCSPQAWSSASTLLLLRSALGMGADSGTPVIARPDLGPYEGLTVRGLRTGHEAHDLTIADGRPRWTVPGHGAPPVEGDTASTG